MKFRLLFSCVAGLFASLAISAQAETQLAHVTNNVVDSGNCTIVGINGGTGWISNKITCGADVVYVTHNNTNAITCSTTVTPGYHIYGGCSTPYVNSYELRKDDPVIPPVLVKITDIVNRANSTNAACRVDYMGGGGYGSYFSAGYRVTCDTVTLGFSTTTNYGTCTLGSAPTGYSFSGGCDYFTIYKVN